MSLETGRKLAHYEILEPIGKGGMGEVYRARDGKLGRDVAIKVLPVEFSRDAERLARFKREAKVLASLNHPNIAAIFGLEQSESIHYLVLELVPGETLAERVARGPIPVDEAVEIATKIAEGLEEAHERGIVHRDLKPANVMLTPDGKVKILDFGLAKAFVEEGADADSSMSPTLTRDATRVGVILGTAAYMSPEQAKGKQLDRRTDIFAFGAVLYEMLTGKKAFRGDNVSEVLASVIKDEPDWDALPSDALLSIERVVRRCLNKTVARRFQHIGDAGFDLEEPVSMTAPVNVAVKRYSRLLLVATLIATGVAVWALLRSETPVPKPVSRWTVLLPPGGAISHQDVAGPGTSPSVAISPDGRHLAYLVARGSTSHLYLRAADALQGEPVDSGERATTPFFSPDSQTLGFATVNGTLMKVSVRGGAPVAISEVGLWVRGASWGPDGNIFFNPGTAGGLYRVSADGGEQEVLASPRRDQGEKAYRFAEVLPGGQAVVFTLFSDDIESFDDASIAVLSLETGEVRTLVEGGSSPRYSVTGHLVYARAGDLFAVPFDARALEVTGAPVRVLEGVAGYPAMGSAEFSLSLDGSLFYAPGEPIGIDQRVVWVDRTGTATTLVQETRAFYQPRVSPDGRSLAVVINDANMGLWVYDIARGSLTRIVSGSNNWNPVWAPDGEHVTFSSDRGGTMSLFSTASDGSGQPKHLNGGAPEQNPESWTPDGQTLVFKELSPETGYDIWLLSAAGDTTPFLQTSANEKGAEISPNGRWMAYQSDESGRMEIYVCPFPQAEPKRQVSIEGGTEPLWKPDGRELFYRDGYKIMSVETETEGTLALAQPQLLFESDSYMTHESTYAVSADGERFVMIDQSESVRPPTELVLVQNRAEELKRLVPTDN